MKKKTNVPLTFFSWHRDIFPEDINGKIHGYSKIYYSSGNIMAVKHWVHGIRMGLCVWYQPNGNVHDKEYHIL